MEGKWRRHSLAKTYEDGTDSVPKRQLLELRRRGITQKKTYYALHFADSC